jgi:hypothetical protein
MHKFISIALVAVSVSVASGGADAAPSCTFDGTWTASNPGGKTTFTSKVVTATHTMTVDRSGGGLPSAHIEGVFTYDSSSGKITITNKSVSTPDMAFFACLDVPGTYTVNFTDCSHLTLSLVSDNCMPRTQGPGHATFTKQ